MKKGVSKSYMRRSQRATAQAHWCGENCPHYDDIGECNGPCDYMKQEFATKDGRRSE